MDKESYPENCSTGIITPIFKKGDRTLPKNYTGITLLPIMGKIFTKSYERDYYIGLKQMIY